MFAAVERGNVGELAELIRQNPGFNVNRQDGNERTLLNHACYDAKGAVVPLLLAHPDIDVNLKNNGDTPFLWACFNGHTACVRLLLKDLRVKVNEPSVNGSTPLRFAAVNGNVDTIRWWIASGREMDLGKPGDVYKTDVIGVAKIYHKTQVVTLWRDSRVMLPRPDMR